MGSRQIRVRGHRKKGFSIIEVITAVAILGIGIWAIVALFPKGQDIIRRSGLRQLATQLAHETISDFLTDLAKMPFAIVPFNPDDPRIANRPVLLEPADLLTVRSTYNFVWGEPLDDGLPPGDPNKRVGLVPVDIDGDNQPDEWRAILRFAPARVLRVYREVGYRPTKLDRNGDGSVDPLDVADFEFFFDRQSSTIDIYFSDTRPRFLRVSYELEQPIPPISRIWREFYIVQGTNRLTLNRPASRILGVVEEFPIPFKPIGNGALAFDSSTPAPSGVSADQLGPLCADYIIDELRIDNDGDGQVDEDGVDYADNDGDGRIDEDPNDLGPLIDEFGVTFAPDPSLQQRLNLPPGVGVFQTTFGGLVQNSVQAVSVDPVDPDAPWGTPLNVSPLSDFSSGLLVLEAPNNQPLPPNRRVRVAYLTEDSWFIQVIIPPNDFQLEPPDSPNKSNVLQQFPYEKIRWFEEGTLRFSPLLAGQSLEIRWTSGSMRFNAPFSLDSNGNLSFPPNITRLDAIQRASILVRVSGQSMWQQELPRRKGDFVELISLIAPSRPVLP